MLDICQPVPALAHGAAAELQGNSSSLCLAQQRDDSMLAQGTGLQQFALRAAFCGSLPSPCAALDVWRACWSIRAQRALSWLVLPIIIVLLEAPLPALSQGSLIWGAEMQWHMRSTAGGGWGRGGLPLWALRTPVTQQPGWHPQAGMDGFLNTQCSGWQLAVSLRRPCLQLQRLVLCLVRAWGLLYLMANTVVPFMQRVKPFPPSGPRSFSA